MPETVVETNPLMWELLPPAPEGMQAHSMVAAQPVRHPLWTKQFQGMPLAARLMAAYENETPLIDQGDASLWNALPDSWRGNIVNKNSKAFAALPDDAFNTFFKLTLRWRMPVTTAFDRFLYPYCPRIEYNKEQDKVECKFFSTPRDAVENRYTATTLARVIKIVAPDLSLGDREIAQWTVGAEYPFRPAKLNIAVTRRDIATVYTGGPNSCMSGSSKNKTCIHPVTGAELRFHPCEAYAYPLDRTALDDPGSNGIAIAYFGPIEAPTGRCIVRIRGEDKRHGRLYGDDRLRQDLNKLGFVHDEHICNEVMISKLRLVERDSMYLVPFIDGSGGYALAGDGIRITSTDYMSGNSSSGVQEITPRCVYCNREPALSRYAGVSIAAGQVASCNRCAHNRDLVIARISATECGWISFTDSVVHDDTHISREYAARLGLSHCAICDIWHDPYSRSYRYNCNCSNCGNKLTAEWNERRTRLRGVPRRTCEDCFNANYEPANGGIGIYYVERGLGYTMPDGTLYADITSANSAGWWTIGGEWKRGAAVELDFGDNDEEEEEGEEGYDAGDDDNTGF